MPAHLLGGGVRAFYYTSSGSGSNLFTKAGSPAVRGDFVFYVVPGVVLFATTTNTRAILVPASFIAGSTLKLIILPGAKVVGAGGAGGSGGGPGQGGGFGQYGGNAIEMYYPLTIDVSQGFIGAGGCGGNGGAGPPYVFPPPPPGNGGGGGGGQGYPGGAAGNPGGTAGTIDAPGTGGPGEDYGFGGDPGENGGVFGSYTYWAPQAYAVKILGGLTINDLRWLGSHDQSRVKGKVGT